MLVFLITRIVESFVRHTQFLRNWRLCYRYYFNDGGCSVDDGIVSAESNKPSLPQQTDYG